MKEWEIVCRALSEGRQIFLLRKGGLADRGQMFRLEHSEFFLYPTREHQDAKYLRPEWAARIASPHPNLPPPGGKGFIPSETLRLESFASVSPEDIWPIPDRAALDRLEDLHIWSRAYLDLRWNYKPEKPLYGIALRVYRLSRPVEIPYEKRYAGCRSWVPLTKAWAIPETTPVFTDGEFRRRRDELSRRLSSF